MIEKRFIVIDGSTCVFDKITKEECVCIDREVAFLVCNKLNNIHETNEYLNKLYADVECRKKGLIAYKFKCNDFKGDVE